MGHEPRKPANEETSDENGALFREAVADVIPLKQQDRILPEQPRPAPRKRPQPTVAEAADDSYSDADMGSGAPLGDALMFRRAGVQHKLMRRLRRGEIPAEAVLDLHGLRVVEARQAVQQLLHQAQASGLRVVRVIHGKGKGAGAQQGVLKQQVNHWLQQAPMVLAFCSAQPADGGTGAVYILLKRHPAD